MTAMVRNSRYDRTRCGTFPANCAHAIINGVNLSYLRDYEVA